MKNNLNDIIMEIAKTARLLWNKGWAERNAGNISVKLENQPEQSTFIFGQDESIKLHHPVPECTGSYFLITAAESRMRDIADMPENGLVLLQINNNGTSYNNLKNSNSGNGPSSELPVHLLIHQLIAQRKSAERVIIHSHVSELIALSHAPQLKTKEQINRIIWGMHPETLTYLPEGIGYIPYELPGSLSIARKTVSEFKMHRIVLWEKHGVFAIGNDLAETFDLIDLVSKSVKIWLTCRQAGFEPEGLNQEQLAEIRKELL